MKIIKREKPRILLLISLLILILFLPVAYYLTTHPFTVQAAWFNDFWGYRQRIDITNGSGSNLSNYQVSFTLNTTDTTKFQTDCNDIRVTASNGELLPHWIEENNPGCGSATTKIWVKVPTIPTSGAYIFVYYGNSIAPNIADGNRVFTFFDDFNNGTTISNKWSVTGGAWSESGGAVSQTSSSTGIGLTLEATIPSTGDFAVEDRHKITGESTSFAQAGIEMKKDTNNNVTYGFRKDAGTKMAQTQNVFGGSGNNVANTSFAYTLNQYHKMVSTKLSNTITLSIDGTQYINSSAASVATGFTTLILFSYESRSSYDYVFLRQYVSSEPTTSAPTNEEKSPAPVAYWKFDEGYGQTSSDGSSNANTATLGADSGSSTDDPAWVAEDLCPSGKCLEFDGSTDFVNIADATYRDDKTISAWIYTNIDNNWQDIVSWCRYVSDPNYDCSEFRLTNTGKLRYQDSSSSFAARLVDTTVNVPVNRWNHVAMTKSGTTVKLYLNGSQVASSTSFAAFSFTPLKFYVGALGWASTAWFFDGKIDDVKVYNYARTADQIKTDYNAGKAHAATAKGTSVSFSNRDNNDALSNGLTGYWKMNEASGNAADSSGNSYTLTNNAVATFVSGKFGNAANLAAASSQFFSTATNLGSVNTIAFWINPTSTTTNILDLDGTKTITAASGTISANSFTSPIIYVNGVVSSTLTANAWQHVTVTTTSAITTNSFKVGKVGSNYFDGKIDEVRLYNRALQPAEVSFLYNFAPGPVGYWKFDENTGTAANDTSGTGLTGTWNGTGSHWTNGKYGAGGNFNGSDDFTNISDNTAIKFGAGNFTITAWVNSQQAGQEDSLVSKDNVGVTNVYYKIYKETNDKVTCAIWDGTTASNATSITALSTYKWYQVACVRDGDNVRVYVNGVNENTSTGASGVNTDSTAALKIGAQRPTTISFFKGLIDDVRIYNYARTAGQIVEDMNAGHPIGGSPLSTKTAYWKFDEGYGATAFNSGTSGSTNNGTLTPGSSGVHTVANQMWSNRGQIKKAADFDGVDDRIVAGTAAILHGKTAGTLSAWVKTTSDSNAEDTIYSENWAGAPVLQMNISSDNKLGFNINQSGGTWQICVDTATFTANRWYYLVGTFDVPTHTIKFYVDNVLKCTNTSWNGTFNGTISQILIGDHAVSGVYSWTGLIDEMKIYNSALTADQIKLDYNQGSAQVLGYLSTSSDGTTASNSAERSYCVPGDTGTCSAPVGEWNFNENTGTSTNDTSGNGNTGTWNGTGNHWKIGKFGSSGGFNGSDDFVTMGDPSDGSLDFGTGDFSVGFWVRTVKTSARWDPVNKVDASGAYYAFYWASSSSFVFDTSAGVGANTPVTWTTPDITDGNWHYIVGVRSGSNLYLYRNGKQVASATGTVRNVSNTGNFCVGKHCVDNNFFVNGSIDDVKVYNYARTPAQIAWDYNHGAPLAWWKYDECQGATMNDASGNGYSGTWSGTGGATITAVGTCSTAGTAWGLGATGKFNSGMRFADTDDKVTVTDNDVFDFASRDFTISAWARIKASDFTNSHGIIGKGTSLLSTYQYALFYDNNGANTTTTIFFRANSGALNFSTGLVGTIDQWQNIVVTRIGSNFTIYVDGVSAATASYSSAFTADATDLLLGDTPGLSNPDNLILDDVRIYNYGLTQAQIKSLYNQDGAVRYGPTTGSP